MNIIIKNIFLVEHVQDTLCSKEDSNNNSAMNGSKENSPGMANQVAGLDDSFSKAFTMPTKYLPKKKRMKLEATGKSKLPAAGTSDAWLQMQLEKGEKKRQLAEEKKKLDARMKEEKRKVDEKIKELFQRIKKEKS